MQIYLAQVEYCNEYFRITVIIHARTVQAVRNIKAKP